MTLWHIAMRLLRARAANHLLTALILALGLGLMLAATATVDAARGALSAAATRFPLVVGGEIGPVPLVLGSLTGLQDLSDGVPEAVLEDLRTDERVEVAVPLLAGHAVQGRPLLATTPAYLEPRARYPLSEGRIFVENAAGEAAMEVVLGAEAAQGLGTALGEAVPIEHQHAGAPEEPGQLRVVGILAPTGSRADRTLFCPLEAIFHSHGAHEHGAHEHGAHEHGAHEHGAHEHGAHEHGAHEHGGQGHESHGHGRSLSAILVRPRDDAGLLSLQEELGEREGVEVALTGQTLRRVADQVATGGRLVALLVSGVVLITFLSLLLSMYASTLAQVREVALLRVLGARRLQVLAVVAQVMLAVVVAGLAGGCGLALVLARYAESVLARDMGLEATVTLLSPTALSALGVAVLLLLGVGVQPAVAAYHVSASRALSSLPGTGAGTGSYLRWSLRFLVPLAIFVWAQQVSSRHRSEVPSQPLDESSAALFATLAGADPEAVRPLDGTAQRIRGYMYALGDPFTVEDFYLVRLDPRLPRCPFCYRAPTRRERIRVETGGQRFDLYPGQVQVEGELHVDLDADHPYRLQLRELEVVLPP